MAYPDLQTFIEALEARGELKRITTPVSCMLEIAEIADRVSKAAATNPSQHAASFDPVYHEQGGCALLFENVKTPQGDSAMPVLINAYGSYLRTEMALGCDADEPLGGGFEGLAAKVESLVKPEPPTRLMEKVKKGLELAKVASLPPKVVKSGPCQEVVKTGDQINLFDLPMIKAWPDDGQPSRTGFPLDGPGSGTGAGEGRYLTFGGIYTIHPDDAGKPEGEPRPSRNVGMYRAQLIDERHTAMHWHMHHDGARHWRAWKKHNEATGDHSCGMPCAIALGGESVLPYAATAPLPPGISELMFAGFLNGGSIKLVKGQTQDLHVPASSEIVIEGYVSTEAEAPGVTAEGLRMAIAKAAAAGIDTSDMSITSPALAGLFRGAVLEGPFGDHTGFYSLPDRYPIFTVTAITHRARPVYPTTIVGYPPQEDYYLGKATERIFLPLLKTLVPDILDYDLPRFGAFHNCAFIKIRKEYPLQARRVMHAIWGAGQMAWTKSIVVVDESVDVHDHEQVLFHLCANCDPGRDVELVNGPLDILDHAAPRLGAGHKIGFDATRKIDGEQAGGHPVRDFPERNRTDDATRELVDGKWAEYGLDGVGRA